jgi:hypothetical protein
MMNSHSFERPIFGASSAGLGFSLFVLAVGHAVEYKF